MNGPPRGKRDSVIRHILERENGNWMKRIALFRNRSIHHPAWREHECQTSSERDLCDKPAGKRNFERPLGSPTYRKSETLRRLRGR